MPSIPPLFGGKMRSCRLSHPFRVANRFMAPLANAEQVTFSFPVGIRVENIQSQVRPVLHMVDMMDQICPVISTLCFAYLALVPVQLKHIGT